MSGCAALKQHEVEQELIAKVEKNKLKNELLKQGETFYREGNLKESRKTFSELLEHAPKSQIALYRLGNIAFKQGELDQAAEYFVQVIELNPRNAKAHYNLAMVRLIQSETHLKYYAAAVDADTDISSILAFLTQINQFSEALEQE